MKLFTVQVTCEAGHNNVIQVTYENRGQAETFCGLLDGTSPAYVLKPRDDPFSSIGKCMECLHNGASVPFTATIIDEDDT